RLFSGSEAAIVLDIVTGKVPPLLSIRPDLPEGIAQAIESALRVDVCERCPTAAELCERIASGCQGDWTPADHRRVGEWVEEVLGCTLVTRRRQARELAVERGPLAETPEAPPERVLTAADPVWLMPTEDINLLAPAASSPVEPVTVATTPSLGR